MELRQLEYFRQIADTHSFNEAARHLNMSQPPLSYQIHQLEEELGVQLSERTSKAVILDKCRRSHTTNAPEICLIMQILQSLKLQKPEKSEFFVFATTSTTTAVMMPFISTFAKKYPDVNFEVRDGSTYTLYSYLMDGIIDISAARTPLQLNKVNSFTLCSEPTDCCVKLFSKSPIF